MSEEQTKACLTMCIIAQTEAELQNNIPQTAKTGGWLWRV